MFFMIFPLKLFLFLGEQGAERGRTRTEGEPYGSARFRTGREPYGRGAVRKRTFPQAEWPEGWCFFFFLPWPCCVSFCSLGFGFFPFWWFSFFLLFCFPLLVGGVSQCFFLFFFPLLLVLCLIFNFFVFLSPGAWCLIYKSVFFSFFSLPPWWCCVSHCFFLCFPPLLLLFFAHFVCSLPGGVVPHLFSFLFCLVVPPKGTTKQKTKKKINEAPHHQGGNKQNDVEMLKDVDKMMQRC